MEEKKTLEVMENKDTDPKYETLSARLTNEASSSSAAGLPADPTGGESAAAPAKEPLAKTIIKQVLGLAVAGVFLYFAFKDANWTDLLRYAEPLNPTFLYVLACSAMLSHLIRAWRWTILLQPLSDKKISLWNSFCAVMYGYAVNVVLPRGGEVARLVAISKSESIAWAGVLPTMFIDRLLDIAMLVLLLGITITVFPMPMDLPWLIPAGISMCVATFVGLGSLPFLGKIGRAVMGTELLKSRVPSGILSKVDGLLLQFDLGTRSLTNPAKLAIIAASSLAIWGGYFVNLWCMLHAFNLQNVIDLPKALVVFTIGSVGVLVPTPGSVGSYHFLTSKCLQQLGHVNADQSLAFATVLHFMCFIVLTCIPAAVCFIVQAIRSAKK